MSRRLAIHEAAHAAVAGKLGLEIRCAVLGADSSGFVERVEPVGDVGIMPMVLLLLAGQEAERMVFGDAWHASDDLERARAFVAAGVNLPAECREVDEHFSRYEALARAYVWSLRPQIERIAKALLKSRQLSGKQIAPLLLARGVEP